MNPIYDKNGVSLYHGDCAELLPALGVQADLIVTSPPFDDIREYGGSGYDFYRCAPAIAAALAPGGVMCWHTNDAVKDGGYTNSSLRAALYFCDELGLTMNDRIIVHKNGAGSLAPTRYLQIWDYLWVFSKGKPKTFNPIMDRPNTSAGHLRGVSTSGRKSKGGERNTRMIEPFRTGNMGKRIAIWKVRIGNIPEDELTSHPAVMQRRLALDLIQSYSNPGDLVLDPFSGSGTTAYAAMMLNRRAIGVEVHLPYIEDAVATRFAQLTLGGRYAPKEE